MDNALARWAVGHHLFIIFIQGLSIAINRFEIACSQDRLADAERELRDAAEILRISATAMKFAADFSEDNYSDTVRPSMPDRFSGLDMVDHQDMLREMKRMKPVFDTLPPELCEAKAVFMRALADAYDSHVFVCDQFVGDQSSLRTSGTTNSAHDTLNSFKRQRLQALNDEPSNACPCTQERLIPWHVG